MFMYVSRFDTLSVTVLDHPLCIVRWSIEAQPHSPPNVTLSLPKRYTLPTAVTLSLPKRDTLPR